MAALTRDKILELFDFRHCGSADVTATAVFREERIQFKVSSHALCFASPVWKKFLFPPFQTLDTETDTDGNNERKGDMSFRECSAKEIDFSEDDGDALLILLRIAHLQLNQVAMSPLHYERLYQIAILCDQYDCAPLLRPWLESWLGAATERSGRRGQEGWLFIAWVFGREKVFEDLARELLCQVSIGDDGQCRTLHCDPLPEPMPAGIIGE